MSEIKGPSGILLPVLGLRHSEERDTDTCLGTCDDDMAAQAGPNGRHPYPSHPALTSVCCLYYRIPTSSSKILSGAAIMIDKRCSAEGSHHSGAIVP